VPSVTTRLKWLVGALCAWTAFIWGNRISNAWSSTTESTSAKVTSTLLAASFLAFAVGAAVVLWRAWRSPLTDGARRFLVAFAGWTVLVWGVRMVGMVLADHDVAFKAVHAVLGLVSIGLAVALVRSLRTTATTSHSLGGPGRVSTPT
jgi:hypothetical protein